MPILLQIILAAFLVSLIAILAVLLFFKKGALRHTNSLVSLSAGALLAFSFFELLPEALARMSHAQFGLTVFLVIFILFLIEALFHWHNCRHANCQTENHRHLAAFNLLGDFLHNLVDGAMIASTFLVDSRLGIITTLAVILHEIPQEIADAGILIYAGLSRKKVLIYNYLFSLSAVLGALLVYFFSHATNHALPYLLAAVFGNFIYLSLSDLIPIIHHESRLKKTLTQVVWFISGSVLVLILKFLV